MCGINGYVSKTVVDNLSQKVDGMNYSIFHRGPDEDGFFIYDNRIAMAMRRLSIIDLSTGSQPIYNDSKSLVITFNGEIYNYKILRQSLQEKGVSFSTSGDTEVVLKMYEHYGESSFSMLDGMFAFAITDVVNNKVIIARDKFGEKPLYYFKDDHQRFIWASELKSIINVAPGITNNIDEQALSLFFSLSYIPSPFTIYKEVRKLKPGNYITLNTTTLEYSICQYWNIEPQQTIISDYSAAKQQLRNLLYNSIESRMHADVPLGVFLSGGVDSSIVAATMADISSSRRIKTFSIGFNEKLYDETPQARLMAQHINSEHYEFILEPESMLAGIDNIITNFDEPFSDSSALPTFCVAQQAVQHVKVALTGDGGDEIFGGYNKYLLHTYGQTMNKILSPSLQHLINHYLFGSSFIMRQSTKSALAKIKRAFNSLSGSWEERHFNIMSMAFPESKKQSSLSKNLQLDMKIFFKEDIDYANNFKDVIKKARYIDKNISLEGDMLVKVDRTSMLCSLECRAPFLNADLLQFSYQLPDSFLIKGNNKKRILKDAFADVVPQNFFKSKKSGFEIPIGSWLRTALRSELEQFVNPENLRRSGYFNHAGIKKLVNEHLHHNIDHSRELWAFYCFNKWYNKNI
jgi:asparagine synthase (glutamine-hydrolysing)